MSQRPILRWSGAGVGVVTFSSGRVQGWESVCWGVRAFLVSWFLGFLVSWFLGFLVSWFLGFLVSWFLGLLVYWFLGFLVSWFQSFRVSKFRNFFQILKVSEFQWFKTPLHAFERYRSHIQDVQECPFHAFWKILIPYSWFVKRLDGSSWFPGAH